MSMAILKALFAEDYDEDNSDNYNYRSIKIMLAQRRNMRSADGDDGVNCIKYNNKENDDLYYDNIGKRY